MGDLDADQDPNDSLADRGQAYIYFGGTNPDNIADITLSGDENAAKFGYVHS